MSKLFLVLALALVVTAPAEANLLRSGDFGSATDLAAWRADRPDSTTLEWFPRDGTDDIVSGSLKLSGRQGGSQVFVTSCFERPAGVRFFEVGGRVAILDDQGPQVSADSRVMAFLGMDFLSAESEEDCLARANGFGATPLVGPRSWTDTKNVLSFDEVRPEMNWGFVKLGVDRRNNAGATAIFDGIYAVARKGRCFPTETTTCYLEGRFMVTGEFYPPDGSGSGSARAAALQSDNSGVLTFFGPENWEILVKVLDGCSLNERYWVFLAATTNVRFRVVVRDLLAETARVYEHPGGDPAPATTDIDAFPTCGL